MKKLLTITAVGVLLTAPAIAVQRCVAIPDAATAPDITEAYENETIWTASYPGIEFDGLAMCAATSGTNYARYGSINYNSESLSENKYCWCRIIKPVVSYWVLAGSRLNQETCMSGCAENCANFMNTQSAFRTSIFGILE